MKQYLLTLFFAGSISCIASAQTSLAPDQNPDFDKSRSRYMAIADSVNAWHGTTVQQTYKAFDWYENKMERRRERVQFRRDLRMWRARSYNQRRYAPAYYDRYNYNYYNPGRGYRNHGLFCWF